LHLPLKETVSFCTASAISKVIGKKFAKQNHKSILTSKVSTYLPKPKSNFTTSNTSTEKLQFSTQQLNVSMKSNSTFCRNTELKLSKDPKRSTFSNPSKRRISFKPVSLKKNDYKLDISFYFKN
jgi:hypothetical protein